MLVTLTFSWRYLRKINYLTADKAKVAFDRGGAQYAVGTKATLYHKILHEPCTWQQTRGHSVCFLMLFTKQTHTRRGRDLFQSNERKQLQALLKCSPSPNISLLALCCWDYFSIVLVDSRYKIIFCFITNLDFSQDT